MSSKIILFIIFALGLFSLAAIITLFFNTSPNSASIIWFFYLNQLIFTTSFLVYAFVFWHYFKFGETAKLRTVLKYLRSSFLYSLGITLLIYLKANGFLTWPKAIIIIVLIITIEYYLQKRHLV